MPEIAEIVASGVLSETEEEKQTLGGYFVQDSNYHPLDWPLVRCSYRCPNVILKKDLLAKEGWHDVPGPIVDDSICTGVLPVLASVWPQCGRGQPVGRRNQTDRDLANFTSSFL